MAIMNQTRFQLGLHLRPRWEGYSAPPDTVAGFKGPISRGGKGKGETSRERRAGK